MARFARFLAAVLCFPLVWALCRTFVDSFFLVSGPSEGLFSTESIALFSGLVAFLALWPFVPDPVRFYVLGHELTHAVVGLAFGARVSNLKVGEKGGSVQLTKSNVWITLAPYFLPFWTMVVVLLALAVRGVMHFTHPGAPFPAPWAWMFAVGFTWCFHACFTIRSLMQTQPDVQEYGRVFSWTFILICNIAGVLLWIVCTTDVSASALATQFGSRTVSAYRAVTSAGQLVFHETNVKEDDRHE